MKNLNCFKSFDLQKGSNYDIHQMIFQHQLIMKNLSYESLCNHNQLTINRNAMQEIYLNESKKQIYHDENIIK